MRRWLFILAVEANCTRQPIKYFSCIATFKAPYRWTSIKGGACVCFIAHLSSLPSVPEPRPSQKFSNTALWMWWCSQNYAIFDFYRDCHSHTFLKLYLSTGITDMRDQIRLQLHSTFQTKVFTVMVRRKVVFLLLGSCSPASPGLDHWPVFGHLQYAEVVVEGLGAFIVWITSIPTQFGAALTWALEPWRMNAWMQLAFVFWHQKTWDKTFVVMACFQLPIQM